MRLLFLTCLPLITLSQNGHAEVLSTQQLLEQQEQWKGWAEDGTPLQITGRYRGTSGTIIQLQKLKLNLVPERGLLIPERIRTDVRLAIFGRFVMDGRDVEFRMSRCDVRKSDQDEFLEELSKVDSSDALQRYQIIEKYLKVAEFFGDRQLQLRARHHQQLTFSQQRRDAQGDPAALWTLIDPGPGFDMGQRLRQELLFQICWLKSRRPADADVLELIRSHLPGWEDQNLTLPQTMVQEFEKDAVAAYESAHDLHRRQLERLLYRRVKLKEITAQLAPDGSHGNAIHLGGLSTASG